MKRKKYESEAKLEREAVRRGLVGPYTPAPPGPTCCNKALYGGCEHLGEQLATIESQQS